MGLGGCFEGQFATGTITRPAIGERIGAITLPFLSLFHDSLPSSLWGRRTDCPD
jgi:hypothetical protein